MYKDIRTILVPYDGTEDSENALREGVKLSKIFNSRMIILYVIEDKFFTKPYLQKIIPYQAESKNKVLHVIDNAVSSLMRKKVSHCEEMGISARYVIERGYPTEIILKTARESHAVLIMMGRKGLRGIEKIKTIGSISRKVAENVDVPVVLVGSRISDEAYDKILVPYDVEDPNMSNNALDAALRIKGNNGEHKIIVLHIVPEILMPTYVSNVQFRSKITGQEISIEQYLKEMYYEIKDDAYRFIVSKIGKDLKYLDILVSYGNPSTKISEFVAEQEIDFVIMGTNTLHGVSKIASLGSVTRKVAESIDCPIMLIR